MMKYNDSFKNFIAESIYFKKMEEFVVDTKDICPLKENVFRFLKCDINNAKCIILGMDPYTATYDSNEGKLPVATGRAFEVANIDFWTDKYKQVSLSNIFKTLFYLKFDKIYSMEDLRHFINKDNFRYINIHDWFDAMENSGVIFLNATLTSLIGKTGAHINIWKDFMDELFRYIIRVNNGIKWLIWGNSALKRVDEIVDKKNIIYTCHPATRNNNTFIQDCCFKYVDSIEWV